MKTFILSVFLLINFIAFAQNHTVNFGVDTISPDKKAVAELWFNYLKSNPDSLYNNPFWNGEEKQRYKGFDFQNCDGYLSPSLHYFNRNNKILSISDFQDGYLVRSMFHYPDCSVIAITNVVAKKENGKFVLANYLPYHTKNWQHINTEFISYVVHPNHIFDKNKVEDASTFLRKFYKVFDIQHENITYFIGEDCDKTFNMLGFDYIVGMGTGNDCGHFDELNKFIYATSFVGENHKHEFTRLINSYFPNGHYLFLNGLSVYWSENSALHGKDAFFHIKRINEFLQNHPETDLNNITDYTTIFMDYETDPHYFYGALFVDYILKNGGIKRLKEVLNTKISDDDFENFIEKELNIAPKTLNFYIRQTLQKIVKAGNFEIVPMEKFISQ
jgi:hypothetical protein